MIQGHGWMTRSAWAVLLLPFLGGYADGVPPEGAKIVLPEKIDLTGKRTRERRFYRFVTDMYTITHAGRTLDKTAVLYLEAAPEGEQAETKYRYTCRKLVLKRSDGTCSTFPRLEGWSYLPDVDPKNGQITGIPEEPFVGLKDQDGKDPAAVESYNAASTFGDFHCFHDSVGRHLQTRMSLGDRVDLGNLNVEAAVSVKGTAMREGSTFTVGKTAMEALGLVSLAGRPAALVGYDIDDCKLKLKVTPAPGMSVTVHGYSHIFGNLWIDLASRWPQRFTFDEAVACGVPMPGQPLICQWRKGECVAMDEKAFRKALSEAGNGGKPEGK